MKHIPENISKLLKDSNYDIRLKKQFIYDSKEETDYMHGSDDVSDDISINVLKGLYHRYPTKVLIFPTESCFGECRFCFRKHIRKDSTLSNDEFEKILQYIIENPSINEVIFSGGDPMTLSNERLFYMIKKIREISTIKIIRIHTRVLTYAPERIDNEFIEFIKSNQPLFMVFHINSAIELSSMACERALKLSEQGISCYSQTALLHEINDTFDDMKELLEKLILLHIKPYYLFHPDMVKGNDHFYVTIEKGIDIYKKLYNNISGLAMPIYLLNIPGGGGHCIMDLGNINKVDLGCYEVIDWQNNKHNFTEVVV